MSLLLISLFQLKATSPIYNKDGLQLTQTITKVTTVYCTALNKNVVVWKSAVEIKNTSAEALNLQKPVYVKFNRSYVSAVELNAIRNQGIGYNISTQYRNIVVNEATILNANQIINSEKYYVTFESIDLSKEQYTWDLQYQK